MTRAFRHGRGLAAAALACVFVAAQTQQQTPTPAQQPAADKNAPETNTKDEPVTFQTRVNLVMVPVVVRDSKGKAIGTFHQEDFQLFDKGKLQTITKFSVEKASQPAAMEVHAPETEKPTQDAPPPNLPDRFIAYMFDDVHIQFGDLARVRDAAARHMANELKATDRAAIYTTSGQNTLEFTDDREKLHETLALLRPRPIARSTTQECPDISYYMADLLVNHNDPTAVQAATMETIACMSLDPTDPNTAKTAAQLAQAASYRALTAGQQETRVALAVLKDVIRRMSAMPGQRTIVLASPGFITPFDEVTDKADVMDRAIRAKVIINTLDARGLYTDTYDITKQTYDSNALRYLMQYDREAARAQADVLAELAAGTGGSFIENSNDFDGGYKRLATAPEYFYLLGFSPQNLKLDGSFHALKVVVKPSSGLSLSARRGYYAPRHLSNAEETAKQEIEEALFSREEMHDLPVELHTQFFKSSDDDARLTVVAGVSLRPIKFRKENGRNHNTLTIVSGLFDRNGNFVSAVTKKLEMRLLDERLERWFRTGITVKTSFDVKPGTYMVRLVVRDEEGQMISAENGAVEIP